MWSDVVKMNSNDIIAVEEINKIDNINNTRIVYAGHMALGKIKEFTSSGALFRYVSRQEYHRDGFLFSEGCHNLPNITDNDFDGKPMVMRAKL